MKEIIKKIEIKVKGLILKKNETNFARRKLIQKL